MVYGHLVDHKWKPPKTIPEGHNCLGIVAGYVLFGHADERLGCWWSVGNLFLQLRSKVFGCRCSPENPTIFVIFMQRYVRPIFSVPTNQRRLEPDIYVGQLVLADAWTCRMWIQWIELSNNTRFANNPQMAIRGWMIFGCVIFSFTDVTSLPDIVRSKKRLELFVSSFASFNLCWLKKLKAFQGIYRHSGNCLWSPSVRQSTNV